MTKAIVVPKKRGKKPRFIVEEAVAELSTGELKFFDQKQIALYYKVNYNYWFELTGKHPELYDAVQVALDKTKHYIEHKALEQIDKGNVSMLIFALKARCGWSENNKLLVEHSTKEKAEVLEKGRLIEAEILKKNMKEF